MKEEHRETRCETWEADPCDHLNDEGDGFDAHLVTASDIGMARILIGMTAFGLSVGLLFPFAVDGWILWRPGQEVYFRLACVSAGLLVGLFAYAIARLTLYRTNRRLKDLAAIDPLTGLFNQHQFNHLLAVELCRASRQGHAVTLVVADLDHFKKVNDSCGHPTGNRVLTRAGHLIKEQVRPYDSACRIGGEEFGIILPEVENDEGLRIAERIRQAIEAWDEDYLPNVTISLGVATFPTDATTPGQLVTRADDAMYRAKAAGRNRTIVWSNSSSGPVFSAPPETAAAKP
ncbi:MAG: hypothetical protein Kow00129_06860 [Thermoleophilia bacterium]